MVGLLSFVIPCYRSEKTITKVINEIANVALQRKGFDYEIIAVNDCSPDNVYEILAKTAEENKRIKVINLVKNMGKHSAILAGYAFVKGDYVINLDDDLQSPIENVWSLLDPVINGECDVAIAEYTRKQEAVWKRIGSNVNLAISEVLLDKPKGMRFENLSAMNRMVLDEVLKYKNPYPFLEGLVFRVTNKVISVPMEQRERGDDNPTGFTFRRSFSLFINGFTNFSVKPLRIALIIGLFFALIGIIYGAYVVVRRILHPYIPAGWSSLMSVILFSSGTIMIILGIIGEYIGRIFICMNDSPQYVIRNTINV